MKVFLSWSGDASRAIAKALHGWLPDVIQSVEPWMSASSIDAGARWANEVAGELGSSNFGIVCVTPENLTSPWLLFEAGALSKLSRARVVPYLLDLQEGDVTGPLSQFQMTTADEAGTLKLLESVNNALDEHKVDSARLQRVFEAMWGTVATKIAEARKQLHNKRAAAIPQRDTRDILEELLELARAQERRAQDRDHRYTIGDAIQQELLEPSNVNRLWVPTLGEALRDPNFSMAALRKRSAFQEAVLAAVAGLDHGARTEGKEGAATPSKADRSKDEKDGERAC